MSGVNVNPEVHTTLTDSGKNTINVVFHQPGAHPLPASAGVPATAAKGAASQTISVHGTVAGSVIFDNQLTK